MTVKKTGVGADSQDRIIIDAGAVYTGWTDVDTPGTLLGATKGGNVFELNRTIRRMDPDGSKGPVKGFRRIEEVVATLTVNLLEITEANLMKAIAGSNSPATPIVGGEIEDSDYISNVVLVGTMSDPALPGTSKPIICILENCLVTGPFTLAMNPKDEAVLTMVFEAHYLPADLDTEPWSIEYPAA